MTLEVDTKEKGMDTESHTLHRHKQKTRKPTHISQGGLAVVWRNRPREAAHLCRMRPLMGRRASYMVRASLVQSLGSIRNDATVRRIRNPGVVVSFTWQLTPPQEEKMFNGTLAPGRLA